MIDILQEFGPNFLWSDGYHWSGLAVTLWLLVTSAAIGLLAAIPLALIRTYSSPWFALPVRLYTLVFRGTPLFVQLLIIYSGMASLSVIRESPGLWWFFKDGMHCVILALALNTCAYTIEILSGVLRTTPRGEIEAALALGMTRSGLFIHLLIPGMLRRALPAYSNEVIFVLHATAIAFTATVPDILKIAADVNAATFKTFQAYGIAALLYMLVAFTLVGLFRATEHRLLAYQRLR
ncbi:histidine ABC transporter permease HisM [Pseudomonas viridiflava]|uniref:Histidine/lysine/arginine/ornithine transport system permease protein HisM n=1 Tax=Pseudomonas viridiflava TaxID=33069 RepID=A0AA46ZU18_PSEVI|nr:histidine ABC transporter permease HisM [Pseudomonas viridiflava]QXG32804.1 histidine ABC transporter permease HisM [Pseudomonas viridiflava]UZA69445.1 histidine ABC transporter permease HisM [Pseudomonas viridiflava]